MIRCHLQCSSVAVFLDSQQIDSVFLLSVSVMPISPARRAEILLVRRRIFASLGVKGLTAQLDANVMRIARSIYPLLTGADIAAMDEGIDPHWLTAEAIRVMLGGGEPPDVAVRDLPPMPALDDVEPTGPSRRYVWSRVVDVYLTENRVQLRQMSKHPHQWRRTGLRMWRRFEKVEERMPYIAKMRARRNGGL